MQKTLSVINLRAIRANAEKIRRGLNGKKFFAVVKADAYGHGAEAVSRSIEDLADGFCVALAEEGAALRIAGISKPILVFTPPLDGYRHGKLLKNRKASRRLAVPYKSKHGYEPLGLQP